LQYPFFFFDGRIPNKGLAISRYPGPEIGTLHFLQYFAAFCVFLSIGIFLVVCFFALIFFLFICFAFFFFICLLSFIFLFFFFLCFFLVFVCLDFFLFRFASFITSKFLGAFSSWAASQV